MAEVVIYLNHCNTQEIKEAGIEALDWDLRVIGRLGESLQDSNAKFVPFPEYLRYRNQLQLHDSQLSYSLRKGWKSAKYSLVRMLVRAGLMAYPSHTDAEIKEHLETLPNFETTFEALSYLQASEKRINFLISDQGQKRMDTFRWGAFAYTETSVLEMAVYDRLFLSKPGSAYRISLS